MVALWRTAGGPISEPDSVGAKTEYPGRAHGRMVGSGSEPWAGHAKTKRAGERTGRRLVAGREERVSKGKETVGFVPFGQRQPLRYALKTPRISEPENTSRRSEVKPR
jgi:hypothetical protein